MRRHGLTQSLGETMNKERIVFHINQHADKRVTWFTSIFSSSCTMLALLVALQDTYLNEHTRLIWLLQLSWVLFFLTIASSLVATSAPLYLHMAIAQQLEEVPALAYGEEDQILTVDLRWYHKYCGAISPLLFVVSILLLCIFGISNTPSQMSSDKHHKTHTQDIDIQNHKSTTAQQDA